jgi:hypothetical protein
MSGRQARAASGPGPQSRRDGRDAGRDAANIFVSQRRVILLHAFSNVQMFDADADIQHDGLGLGR